MAEIPNWFAPVAFHFERYLGPHCEGRSVRLLQLGVFAGEASQWMYDHVLDGNSVLDDVDTWRGSAEHGDIDFAEVERAYDARSFDHRVRKHRRSLDEFFAVPHSPYDFAYVDEDHIRAPSATPSPRRRCWGRADYLPSTTTRGRTSELGRP